MKLKLMISGTTALVFGTFGAYATAEQTNQQQANQQQAAGQQAEKREISLVSGHNVVDAVDDLRETTADLIGAILEAEEGLGVSNWEQKEVRLNQMEANLEQMELTLDRKAEASDTSWLNWLEDRDYTVTVKEQVNTLGTYLSEKASLLNEASLKPGLQVVTGHNIVDQVDDVRETAGDLLNAVSNAGPGWGWFEDNEMFNESLSQLNQMEQTLDAKAEMSDEEWESFIASPEYRTTVHDQIDSLGNMISNVANQMSTGEQVTQR